MAVLSLLGRDAASSDLLVGFEQMSCRIFIFNFFLSYREMKNSLALKYFLYFIFNSECKI